MHIFILSFVIKDCKSHILLSSDFFSMKFCFYLSQVQNKLRTFQNYTRSLQCAYVFTCYLKVDYPSSELLSLTSRAYPCLWAPWWRPGSRAPRCSRLPAAGLSSCSYTNSEQCLESQELEVVLKFLLPLPPHPPLLQPGSLPERGCPPSCAVAAAEAS